MKLNLSKDATIFDVEANVGDWSRATLNIFNSESISLYMFEPLEATFKILKRNIRDNTRCFYVNTALGDKEGVLNLSYDFESQGSAGVFLNGLKTEKVNVTTLNEYCLKNEIKKIDFLKMDVQGYEYQILHGADMFIKNRLIDFIQFEIDETCINNRIFFKDFWLLLNNNYKIYHSLYNGLVEIKNYDASLENFRCMNYLAILK